MMMTTGEQTCILCAEEQDFFPFVHSLEIIQRVEREKIRPRPYTISSYAKSAVAAVVAVAAVADLFYLLISSLSFLRQDNKKLATCGTESPLLVSYLK